MFLILVRDMVPPFVRALLTRSRSVIMPTTLPSDVTRRQPWPDRSMAMAVSLTVLLESTIIGSLAITSLTRFDVTGSSLSSDNRSAPRAESAVRALRDLYVRANIHNVIRAILDFKVSIRSHSTSKNLVRRPRYRESCT